MSEETINIIDNATKHFQTQLSGELLHVEVPEWDCKIYFKPAFTFAQQEKIITLSNEGKMVEALVETLIVRALDADGKKVFRAAQKPKLMHEIDPNVIIRVVTEMKREINEEDLGKH